MCSLHGWPLGDRRRWAWQCNNGAYLRAAGTSSTSYYFDGNGMRSAGCAVGSWYFATNGTVPFFGADWVKIGAAATWVPPTVRYLRVRTIDGNSPRVRRIWRVDQVIDVFFVKHTAWARNAHLGHLAFPGPNFDWTGSTMSFVKRVKLACCRVPQRDGGFVRPCGHPTHGSLRLKHRRNQWCCLRSLGRALASRPLPGTAVPAARAVRDRTESFRSAIGFAL